MTVRLVLAEDSFLMREGIASALALDTGLELVSSCGSYDELLGSVARHHPDVVITDIRMPPTQTDEGIRAAHAIRESHPGVGVVVLSQHVAPEFAVRLFERGSEGLAYLLKERVGDIDALGSTIRLVVDGGTVVDPQVVDALMAGRATRRGSTLDRLTDREREVLAETAKGASNAAIGEALHISARSVEKHISSIFTKLDLHDTEDAHRRVQAVLVHLGVGEL